MNVLTIAGKEFDDSVRSRSLWTIGVVLVGALVAVTAGYALVSPNPRMPSLVAYLVSLTKWLVPVTALVVSYDAVVGERTAGTMRLLFGFPYTRGQVLLGKAIGRFAAVVAPLTAGLLASFLLSAVLYPRPAPREYALLLGTTSVLAAAFVGLAVAASTLSRSAVRVVAFVVGAFVLFLFLWDVVPAAVHVIVTGEVLGARAPPGWYLLLKRVNPVESFLSVLGGTVPWLSAGPAAGTAPYLSWWSGLLLLIGWATVPLGIAYARFRRVDLA